MRAYRSKFFNDERKWKSKDRFDDVRQVGVKKAIGCVTFWGEERNLDYLNSIKNEFLDKLSIIISEEYFDILWVGDLNMIQEIINKHENLLIKYGWTTDAAEFFVKVSVEQVDHDKNPEIYHLICELFNSWCLWCEKPIWFDINGTHLKQPLSTDPYDPDE